jgi:triosephosphate isomerase
MKALIAGNWKMNGLGAALGEIAAVAAAGCGQAEIVICPPATLIDRAVAAAGGRIAIGGQDCHAEVSGAFTGDVSAEMLKDAGADWVIVGHSERRQYHAETDAAVSAKVRAAWRAGLRAIVCVGETEAERVAGRAFEVVARQVASSLPDGATGANTAIAYEPIWAIGSGRTPSSADIADMHARIRAALVGQFATAGLQIRILYGGSVKPANARDILALAEVGGALVGGASLNAQDFRAIVDAAPETLLAASPTVP